MVARGSRFAVSRGLSTNGPPRDLAGTHRDLFGPHRDPLGTRLGPPSDRLWTRYS